MSVESLVKNLNKSTYVVLWIDPRPKGLRGPPKNWPKIKEDYVAWSRPEDSKTWSDMTKRNKSSLFSTRDLAWLFLVVASDQIISKEGAIETFNSTRRIVQLKPTRDYAKSSRIPKNIALYLRM